MVAEGSRSHTSATTLIPCPLCSIRCWVGHICGLLGIFVYAASPKHPSVCLTFAAIPVVGIKKRKHLPATIMVASGVFSFFCPFGGEASISTELIVVTYVSSNSSVACHSHRQKVRNAGLIPSSAHPLPCLAVGVEMEACASTQLRHPSRQADNHNFRCGHILPSACLLADSAIFAHCAKTDTICRG